MSKLTERSRGNTCIRCGGYNAYACHYNGPRQHDYGKGRGIKANDMATADFCMACDDEFIEGSNSPIWGNKWERSEVFLHYCMLTNIRRFNEGVLKT